MSSPQKKAALDANESSLRTNETPETSNIRTDALCIKEIAGTFGVTRRTIHRWLESGKLKPSFLTPSGRKRFVVEGGK